MPKTSIMKRLYYSCFLACLAIIGLHCQKELSFSSSSNEYATLHEFFEKNQPPTEGWYANSSNPLTLTTRRGTKFIFQPNSFETLDGQPVTGTIWFEVKEIFNSSEMILSRTFPMSNGQPLESGGEFMIKPSTQSGQELRLKHGYLMKIKLPSLGIGMDNMRVFNGQPNTGGSDSKVNWVVNSNPNNTVFADSLLQGRYLFADSVNWINCDRFLNEPRINYAIYPGNVNGFDSVSAFIHFSGRNSVVAIPWHNAESRFYSQSVIVSPATVIGIGIKDHKLQASFTSVNLQNNQSATLEFSPVTEAQLKERLAQLH
jgi:hypothetical protein